MVNRDHVQVKVPQCYYAQNYGSSGEIGLLIMKDLCDIAQVNPMYKGLSCEAVKAVGHFLDHTYFPSMICVIIVAHILLFAQIAKYSFAITM